MRLNQSARASHAQEASRLIWKLSPHLGLSSYRRKTPFVVQHKTAETDIQPPSSRTSGLKTGGANTTDSKMSRHPLTKWTQRSDKVFITVELPDAKNVKLTLQPEGGFHFSATTGADNIPYELDFDLFDKVDVEGSKAAVGPRHICYLVKKAEDKWWSRLLKQEGRPPVYLKVDWDRWVDEDEEKEKNVSDMDFGDMDFSKLGMGGEDDDFEDDVADQEGDDDMEELKTEGVSAVKEPEAPATPNGAGESATPNGAAA